MITKSSYAGRLALLCFILIALISAIGSFLTKQVDPWWLAWVLSLLLSIPLLLIGVSKIATPVSNLIGALSDGTDSLKDNDFSISITNNRSDEFSRLVDSYNNLGGTLRRERQNLYQRELMLDTVIQSADFSLILVNINDHIVYSNSSARQLLHVGKNINGSNFYEILNHLPSAFSEAVKNKTDGLFTVGEQDPQTFHISQNSFALNGQSHQLYLFKHLTQEISRQEVNTWKNVIRLISHELNNSLAPISSLAHSGNKLLGDDNAQLSQIFSTIQERAMNLKGFIEGYAKFARLPAPNKRSVNWPDFLQRLSHALDFKLIEPIESCDCQIDETQFEQVIINLIKNAKESKSNPDNIDMRFLVTPKTCELTVSDGGTGMDRDQLSSALLPFYSTKKDGTGLGLPLCREIVEAHGGRLSLSNLQPQGLQVKIVLPRAEP